MMKSMNFLAALLKPAALTSVFVFLLLILCSKRLHFGSTSAKLMEIKVHWAWNLQLHFWLEALCHTQREWLCQCAVTDMKLLLLLFKFVNEIFNGNIETRTFLIFFKRISLPGRLALSLRGFFPSIYSPVWVW